MITYAEKTLINIPTRNGHASNIALCGDDILMVWFGGTEEKSPDVDIYATRLHGGKWCKPFKIAGEEGLPHWNPVLYSNGDTVDLFYKVGHEIPAWHTRHMRSLDGGYTWSEPTELVPGDIGGRGPVRNKPLRLQSGKILCPASIETETQWDAFIDITDENFESFRKTAFIHLDREQNDEKAFIVRGKGVIQPTLWQSADGSVHMLLRSTEGYILRSNSHDEGETWCPAYSTGLKNNNSGIDLTRLQDGRILLVMNPVSGNWAARTPLSLLLSLDDGKSFTELIKLENRPGEYSYPSVIHDDNTVYISYTWNRTKMAFWKMKLEDTAL